MLYMATYKVLQDIEAEDKLLGPLTLKQFIFAIIAIGIGFVEFKLITTPALSVLRWPFVVVLLLPMSVFGFLAAPISRDQPNDIWLLARLRFLIKPHTRIWNQDGISQLVTITVPKKIQKVFTNGLDQAEVKSRLTALASTLDSRGWAIKNVDVNMFAQPDYLSVDNSSDRLVAPAALPSTVQAIDVHAADDMMDAKSNPTALHLDQMVQTATAQHQQAVRESIKQGGAQAAPTTTKATATPTADYYFLNQQNGAAAQTPLGFATFHNSQVVSPGSDVKEPEPTADEKALIAKIEAEHEQEKHSSKSHLKTLQPISKQGIDGKVDPKSTPALKPVDPYAAVAIPDPSSPILPPVYTPGAASPSVSVPAGGTTPNPAIINLANNDDLNVATIARQAKRISEADDEVVISLH